MIKLKNNDNLETEGVSNFFELMSVRTSSVTIERLNI
jgi:hypothetical protein